MRFGEVQQVFFARKADVGIDVRAVFEEEQRRNGTDAVLRGEVVVRIDIDFDDFQFAVSLGGKGFEFRGDGLARAAPGRPEIDKHGNGRGDNFGVKVGLANGDGFTHVFLQFEYARTANRLRCCIAAVGKDEGDSVRQV